MALRLSSALAIAATMLGVAGCVAGKGVSTSTSTTDASSEGGAASTSSIGSTGTSPACTPNADYTCGPIDCTGLNDPAFPDHCGPSNRFDEEGCGRPWCQGDEECAPGEVCYNTTECYPEACVPGTWTCSLCPDGVDCEGECSCMQSADCQTEEGWCIPSANKPC